MRKDILIISIQDESSNESFHRLIEYAKSLVAQHPDWSLDKCLTTLRRYMNIMKMSLYNYSLRLSYDDNQEQYLSIKNGELDSVMITSVNSKEVQCA